MMFFYMTLNHMKQIYKRLNFIIFCINKKVLFIFYDNEIGFNFKIF